METHVVTIYPPLQIVDIGNGCEAYSTSIYIPAKSELTATMQSLTRSQFFLDYNFQYTNVSNFVVWYKTNFATLNKEEITSLKAKIMKLPTMSMDIFDKTLETIDGKVSIYFITQTDLSITHTYWSMFCSFWYTVHMV